MKFYLRNIGITLTVIAIVLSLFDFLSKCRFLLENYLIIFETRIAAKPNINITKLFSSKKSKSARTIAITVRVIPIFLR